MPVSARHICQTGCPYGHYNFRQSCECLVTPQWSCTIWSLIKIVLYTDVQSAGRHIEGWCYFGFLLYVIKCTDVTGELTAWIMWVDELFKWMLKRWWVRNCVGCAGQLDRLADHTYGRQQERVGLLWANRSYIFQEPPPFSVGNVKIMWIVALVWPLLLSWFWWKFWLFCGVGIKVRRGIWSSVAVGGQTASHHVGYSTDWDLCDFRFLPWCKWGLRSSGCYSV